MEWLLLLVCSRGRTERAGVVLFDWVANQLHFKLRPTLKTSDEEIRLIWECLPDEIRSRAEQFGAQEVANWLHTTLSNVIRVTDRQMIHAEDSAIALDALYQEHVERQDLSAEHHG